MKKMQISAKGMKNNHRIIDKAYDDLKLYLSGNDFMCKRNKILIYFYSFLNA